ncbi:MAG: TonB family protein [Tepidisphaera sp.]|nr:TonB family protein [Tepidisphaera sp.]
MLGRWIIPLAASSLAHAAVGAALWACGVVSSPPRLVMRDGATTLMLPALKASDAQAPQSTPSAAAAHAGSIGPSPAANLEEVEARASDSTLMPDSAPEATTTPPAMTTHRVTLQQPPAPPASQEAASPKGRPTPPDPSDIETAVASDADMAMVQESASRVLARLDLLTQSAKRAADSVWQRISNPVAPAKPAPSSIAIREPSESAAGAPVGGAADPGASRAPPGAGPRGITQGPRASSGNLPPVYPDESRHRREQGTVLLHLAIEADGRVTAATIAKSSGYARLDGAALDAARAWRFTPAQSRGLPVRSEANLPVVFSLGGAK